MAIALCITGMHRSGTSLMASWLERCGVAVHDGRVLGPYTGNPKGHFEDLDFFELQSAAIEQLDVASAGWKVTGLKPLEFEGAILAKAEALVEARNAKFALWGWKDPRSVAFLDQWQRLVPGLKVVLLWRPCSEVVASLVHRSGQSSFAGVHIEIEEAVQLWSDYSARMCAYQAAHPNDTVLGSLHSIRARDGEFLQILRDRLGLRLQDVPLADVFEPSLLGRSTASQIAEAASTGAAVHRLERQLSSQSVLEDPDGHQGAAEPSAADRLSQVLHEVSAALGQRDARIHHECQRVRELEAELDRRRAAENTTHDELARLREDLARQDQVVATLKAALDDVPRGPLAEAQRWLNRFRRPPV